ncbi:MAG TPA: TraB/GumN family protein [Steroidobacteraceae bacterium]|nr:TraB/GumN family protein [Steroidobacteraceae bacterium]
MSALLAGALGLSAALLSLPAAAAGGHHILWEVKGRHNTVYLLGSVHMLKPADSELPSEATSAYQQSKTLVMELDLSDPSALAGLSGEMEMGLLPDGQTLQTALGPDLYARFSKQADALGIDPSITTRYQPWLAALMLEQVELAKEGFDAGSGVDMQLAQRAETDGKPIIGLETIDDQLGIFTHLTLPQQRDYMRSTLDETADAHETAQVVQAWEAGDTAALERLLSEGSRDSPQLYQMLTTDRNRRWLPKITQMLNADSNYLVVVGALHLIGHDGVIEMLQRSGYNPVQH